MKTKSRLSLFFVALCCVSAATAGVQAITLKFKTVDIPAYQSTQIYAINNENQGAGIFIDSTGLQHGMIIQGGKIIVIDDPNAIPGTTICAAVNDHGVAVGYYTNADNVGVGFEYQDGNFGDVTIPSALYVEVWGINNSGMITGTYYDPNLGVWNGFVGSPRNLTSFSVPGAYYTNGYDINDAGLMTLLVETSSFGNYSADLYNPTTQELTPINVPGATNSYAGRLNNKNQVIYTWTDSSGNSHGAVRSAAGKFLTFDDPDGTQTQGWGINDSDIMVGVFTPSGSAQLQSFVATAQK